MDTSGPAAAQTNPAALYFVVRIQNSKYKSPFANTNPNSNIQVKGCIYKSGYVNSQDEEYTYQDKEDVANGSFLLIKHIYNPNFNITKS